MEAHIRALNENFYKALDNNTPQSAWTTSFLETHELPVDVSFEPLTDENIETCLSMMKSRSNPSYEHRNDYPKK